MKIVCRGCSNWMDRTRRGPLRFYRCGSCGAHALTDSTLRRILPANLWSSVWPSLRAAAAPSAHRCPACERAMEQSCELPQAANVRLDICDGCRLIWFDPREFEEIPKVPVVEEDVLPPEVAQAIARAHVAMLNAEYDQREEAVLAPILDLVSAILWAVAAGASRRGKQVRWRGRMRGNSAPGRMLMLPRTALLVWIPLVLLASAGAGQDEFAPWIAKLLDADPAVQESGRRILLARGTPALAALRRARLATADSEAKGRLTGVIQRIELREPHGLLFGAGMPKMRLTLGLVNSDRFKYAVSVRNRGDKTVVLWPYFRLRLLDAAGKEVARTSRMGRFGLRRSANLLEGVRFVTLEPGKSWSFQESLVRYMHDPEWITGWKVPRAGTYTLEFTYEYDRAAQKKRCDPKWELLDDPAQPWNRALEFKHTFRAEMTVN
jgi:Zn-finger nucleic acid-binding protein